MHIDIVLFNVHFCVDAAGRNRFVDVVNSLLDFDIILLNEVDVFMERSFNVDQPSRFIDEFQGYNGLYAPRYQRVINGRASSTGNYILSKFPIEFARIHSLPFVSYENMEHGCQSLIEAHLSVSDSEVIQVLHTHLTPLSSFDRLSQLEYIMKIKNSGERVKFSERELMDFGVGKKVVGTLLSGDMNFGDCSAEYSTVVGPMNKKIGRLRRSNGFRELWDFRESEITNPQWGRIDYLFGSGKLVDNVKHGRVRSDVRISDHFPICVQLEL